MLPMREHMDLQEKQTYEHAMQIDVHMPCGRIGNDPPDIISIVVYALER
jgi:hypothetical protein